MLRLSASAPNQRVSHCRLKRTEPNMQVSTRSIQTLVLMLTISVVGCGRAQTGSNGESLTAAEFVAQGGAQDGVVVDVRTPAEFASGHLVDAVNIDFRDARFRQRIQELDTEKTYYLYCRTGNRSGQAAAIMREIGLDVRNIGGISALQAAGANVQAGQ